MLRVYSGIMPRQKQPKTTPVVFTKPDNILSIQLRYKERDKDGRLVFKGTSREITVSGISLDDAYERVLKALKE